MERKTTRPTEKVFNLGTATFVLDPSYSELKVLGQGSYGVVVSAQSERLHKKVAIKKVTPVAKHVVDAKHVLREVRLLRHMGKHENIITLEDLIYRDAQDELYIVMELMDTDLHQVIQSKQPLTEQHFQHFMYQLLCGLKYLHDNRIIHRDLKPGNLLVSRDCRLRITDFGLSRERPRGAGEHHDDDIDEPMTQHVVTRWYRPPELMLCPDGLYTYAVDIWSVGCIFAEMLGRNPLFPGKNFIHQLMLVFDVLGSPLPHETRHIVNPEARKFLSSQAAKPKVSFAKLYPSASSDAWWLLDQMLIFDAEKRITVNDALDCRYFGQCARQLPSSAVYPPVSPEFEFNFERENLTRTQLKQLVAKETLSFKREKQRERLGSAGASGAAVNPPPPASEDEAKPTAKRSASVGTAISRQQQQQQQQQQEAAAKAVQPDAIAGGKGKAHTATATGSRVSRRPAAAGGDDDAKADEGANNDDSSTVAGRKAAAMANYLKNTAASNTRSHSTSRLRPSHTTATASAAASTASTATAHSKDPFQSAKPSRASATVTARDVLREMMEPDAYDFLDLHTQQELQHVKKDPSATATATATATTTAVPPSPKKLAPPRPSDATAPPGHRASSIVKEVEDSLVAKLSKAQIVATAPSGGSGAAAGAAAAKAAASQNAATRDMISETIAAVLNSPRRQAKATAALPVPVSPAAKPKTFAPPAAATETTLGSPTRRKSLMETYSSPKRLVPSHGTATSPGAGPTTAAATVASTAAPATTAAPDTWARKSERWEKLQAEIKQQQDAHAHYTAASAPAAVDDGYDSAEEKERNFLRKSAALRQSQQLQKQLDEANAASASTAPEAAVSTTMRQSHSKVPLVPLGAATASAAQPPPPQPPRQTRYHGALSSSDDDSDDNGHGGRSFRGGVHQGRLDSARGHGDGGGSMTARTLATQASTVVAAHDSADRHRTAQPPRRHSSSGGGGSGSGGATSSSRLTGQRSATYAGTRDEDHSSAANTAAAAAMVTANGNGLSKGATIIAAAADGPSAEKKRKLTVPKSPKFSTMSWQRRRDQPPRDASSGAGGGGGGAQAFEDDYLGISTKPTTAPTATAKARAASTGRAMSRHF